MSNLSMSQSNSGSAYTQSSAGVPPRIALRGLSVAYGPLTVVRQLDLAVGVGECVALLGPSGCGKTTTLNVMAGFAQPSGGDILIDGKSMTGVPPHRRNTTMVFQSYALFPHLTVEQNVAFGLEMRRMPKHQIAERVRHALDIVRLSGFGERLPRQISGGQQQRVALARALAVEPSVLLLDEPMSNLDAQLREEMRLELAEIQRRVAITTVFVTHDQADAMAIADRIAVMNAGRIEQIGSAQALYDQPASLVVAGFIGRMNILDASIVGSDAVSTTVRLAGGSVVTSTHNSAGEAGRAVKLTVRPEHIRLVRAANEQGNILSGTIERVTYLGDILDISVSVGGQSIRAILKGDVPAPTMGQTVSVGWDTHQCQVFAAEGEA